MPTQLFGSICFSRGFSLRIMNESFSHISHFIRKTRNYNKRKTYSVVSIKRTGSLNYLKFFYHPELFFKRDLARALLRIWFVVLFLCLSLSQKLHNFMSQSQLKVWNLRFPKNSKRIIKNFPKNPKPEPPNHISPQNIQRIPGKFQENFQKIPK